MDFLFFGIQGSGKGTQSKLLCEKYGLSYFETGGRLRRLASENSDLGKKIKSILEAGKLVPNEVVIEMVEDFLAHLPSQKTSVIFDGIPRNEGQAKLLEDLLVKHGRKYIGVHIHIPKELAIERLLKRRLCEKCKKIFPPDYAKDMCDVCRGKLITRSDDTEQAIRTRLDVFEKETTPVVDRYRKENRLVEVSGDKPIEESSAALSSLLEPYLKA